MIFQRCTKQFLDSPNDASVHTCTPSPLVRELEQQRDELAAALSEAIITLERDGDEWGICARFRAALAKVTK